MVFGQTGFPQLWKARLVSVLISLQPETMPSTAQDRERTGYFRQGAVKVQIRSFL